MTLIADASSLTSLTKIGLLEVLENKLFISQSVYEEILRGKEKNRMDAFVIEKLASEKKIIVELCEDKITRKIGDFFNLRGADLEVVSLAYHYRGSVLSDDKKCIRAAKVLGLETMTSPAVVVALCKKRRISKKTALGALRSLGKFRWFSNDIVKKYGDVLR